jgi:hypothetical protein
VKGDTKTNLGKAVNMMSTQQITGVVVFLLGVAALIVSAGVAWTVARISRRRQIEGISFITLVAFLLFLAGVVLCYFGVTNLVEGSA